MKSLKHLPAWKALEAHFKTMRNFDMRPAFREDAARFDQLSLRCGNLLLDYSKNRITSDTMRHLMQLARESGLETMRHAMFSGERINFTEKRAVLHTALRAPVRPPLVVEGVDVEREVAAVLDRMKRFAESIHNGSWLGHTGKPVRNVVNIGIGGSPSQTGFEWKFKAIPLDSVSNPINSLAYFRIDSFASVASYEGKLANIIPTKTGSLQTIQLLSFLDSLFYATTEGTNGFEYFSIRNIEAFLIALDEMGIDPNFSFVDFFTSLQDWYDVYQFGSTINAPYNLVDTNVTIAGFPINFKYIGKRLQDQTIPTVLGNFECKKFLLQWRVVASLSLIYLL